MAREEKADFTPLVTCNFLTNYSAHIACHMLDTATDCDNDKG